MILLDFHAEATSDKQIMGRHLDGRVTAVLGTHTHVPTADEQILPGGTAFQCDVGMTGPHESILGRRIDRVMETTLTFRPTHFEVATGDVRLHGTLVEADPASGPGDGDPPHPRRSGRGRPARRACRRPAVFAAGFLTPPSAPTFGAGLPTPPFGPTVTSPRRLGDLRSGWWLGDLRSGWWLGDLRSGWWLGDLRSGWWLGRETGHNSAGRPATTASGDRPQLSPHCPPPAGRGGALSLRFSSPGPCAMSDSRASALRFVLFASGVTAIGGFLFGYDTAVINGANSYIKELWDLKPAWEGTATASMLLGCIPGAMFAGFLSDRFGRKRLLFLCAILYAVSGVLSAFPPTAGWFLAVRFLGGLGIGASSMVCPVYIAEIAPEKWRGRLGTLFQLAIVVGIFLTLFVNMLVHGLGDEAWNTATGWRWMLGLEAVPAVAFLFLLFAVPESPRWLAQQGREGEAEEVLRRAGGAEHAQRQMVEIRAALAQEEGRFSELLTGPFRRPLLIAVRADGLLSILRHQRDHLLLDADLCGCRGRQGRRLRFHRLDRIDQRALHLRRHRPGRSSRPPAAAADRHVRANGGPGDGGLDAVPRSQRPLGCWPAW